MNFVGCELPGLPIGFTNLFDRRLGVQLVPFHGPMNDTVDIRKGNAVCQKGADGHFVGGIEHRRQRTALITGLKCQCQTGKPLQIRGFKCWVIRLMTPPLPAASRPSKMTTTFKP